MEAGGVAGIMATTMAGTVVGILLITIHTHTITTTYGHITTIMDIITIMAATTISTTTEIAVLATTWVVPIVTAQATEVLWLVPIPTEATLAVVLVEQRRLEVAT